MIVHGQMMMQVMTQRCAQNNCGTKSCWCASVQYYTAAAVVVFVQVNTASLNRLRVGADAM